MILFIGVLAIIVSLPTPFMTNRYLTFIMMWFLLFLGAFMLPSMTGMMLNSIKDEGLRTTANSLAILSYNLFGYLPAPFIYGFVASPTSIIYANFGVNQ